MNKIYAVIIILMWLIPIKKSICQNTSYSPSQLSEYIQMNSDGKFNGVSENVLIEKYGSPTSELIQPRYKYNGEENIEIESTYRSTNPEFRNIPIKKSIWHIHEGLNLTSWSHYKNGKWIIICYDFWLPGTLY